MGTETLTTYDDETLRGAHALQEFFRNIFSENALERTRFQRNSANPASVTIVFASPLRASNAAWRPYLARIVSARTSSEEALERKSFPRTPLKDMRDEVLEMIRKLMCFGWGQVSADLCGYVLFDHSY